MLGALDYCLIALYSISMLGIGFYLKRRASGNIEEYFLAGRKLPWWMLGCSGSAAWFDMSGTMLICSFVYMLGPRAIYLEGFRSGAGLVLIFMMLFTGKWHRRSGCMTKAELMTYRFGSGWPGEAARLVTAIGALLFAISSLAYLIRGMGLFMSMFMPLTPFSCALIMIGIAAIYTMLSGFYGVVYTDILQSIIMIAGSIIISVIALKAIPDVFSLGAVAARVTGNSEWTSFAPAFHASLPPGYARYDDMLFFSLFYLFITFVRGLDMGAEPQYFGARNDRECGLLSFIWNYWMMFRWPMMIAFAVLGIYLVDRNIPNQAAIPATTSLIRSFYPNVTENIWDDRLAEIIHAPESQPAGLIGGLQSTLGENWRKVLNLVGFNGTINPERILPAVILDSVPIGLRGLILIAMIAASMSTFAPTVNSASAYFVRDIFQRHLFPRASNRNLMVASYATTLVVVVISFWLGYMAKNINEIAVWILTSLVAGLWIPPMLRFYWWRLNGQGVALGTAVGILLPIIQRALFPDAQEFTQFFVISGLTLATTIVGSLLTKPTEISVLYRFYTSTRPFGFWGPIKKTVPPKIVISMHREHFHDLLSMPFAFFWQLLPYLILMQLVTKSFKGLWVTIPLYIVACLGLFRFWFRNLSRSLPEESRMAETPELLT
ncbi:MAG: sodium:solute symporter [Verrucomicrobia bacterium]|nr:sodium:solute symporter [Verrucomicrobiota bacterium]